MAKVSINAPRTPVTAGSNGIAAATLPNVCKMPGPPAPFVPTPLPNVGRSGISPKGYSKKVKIGGKGVAIGDASFGSQGDAASKGTGGGLVSANTHGPTRFLSPGSMNVEIEGKAVHLLGDMMFNNCGPSGKPANAATMAGVLQELVQAMMFPEQVDRSTECIDQASHTWKCREAKGKKRMDQKINEAADAGRKGVKFEAAAAIHNKASGELTRSSQLSQEPHNEKIFWVCTACGIEREGDQVHDDPSGGSPQLVEVKSKAQLSTADAAQLGRNIQALRQGGASAVIYKVPASGSGGFLSSQLQKLGEIAGVSIRIVRV